MSWSHSLIKETLEEFKDEIQEMTNVTSTVKFQALLDYHEEALDESDYEPFFITGENLPVNLGDKIQIKTLEATALSWDYQDSTYQIINVEFTPFFQVDDIVTDVTQEQFKISEVTKRFYRFTKVDGTESFILPLIYQDLIKKIN
jgi:hypothetical protein